MNPIVVWALVIVLVGGTIFIWYVTYPMVFMMLSFGQTTVEASGILESIQAYGLQSFNFLEWCNLLWCPILCVIWIIWGNLAMHQTDVESELYG